ncbi:MAG: hypothetical protein VKJ24_15440 [Synechococcales bacterium]|nr:hypothetical protein [Synechococcales bacterium]
MIKIYAYENGVSYHNMVKRSLSIATSSRGVQLPYAHWSDSRWDKPQLVFEDKTVKCNEDAYDDRLMDWDEEAHLRGIEKAKDVLPVRSAANFEAYLQGYYEDPKIKIGKVYTGCNPSGYQYWLFAWRKLNDEKL